MRIDARFFTRSGRTESCEINYWRNKIDCEFMFLVASWSLRGNIILSSTGCEIISSEHRHCVAKKPLRHLFCWLRPLAEEFFVTVSFDSVLQFIRILVSKLKFKHVAPSWTNEWRESQQLLEICDDYLCTRDYCDPLRDQMNEATASCTNLAKMLIRTVISRRPWFIYLA